MFKENQSMLKEQSNAGTLLRQGGQVRLLKEARVSRGLKNRDEEMEDQSGFILLSSGSHL